MTRRYGANAFARITAVAAAAAVCAAPALNTGSAGEAAEPLAVVRGRPLQFVSSGARPLLVRTIPAPASANAAADGVLYSESNGNITATNLALGERMWTRRSVDGTGDSLIAAPVGIVEKSYLSHRSWLYDRNTGHVARTFDTMAAGAIGNVLLARSDFEWYDAIDLVTGKRYWRRPSGWSAQASPQIADGVLLQSFVDSGAITEQSLYAFDAQSGHTLWRSLSNTAPLGFAGSTVFTDCTWFPQQMDNYLPLTVCALDLRTGRTVWTQSYRPDPATNEPRTHRNSGAFVSASDVFLNVAGVWYRYDAQKNPLDARARRIDGLTVHGVLPDGTAIVENSNGVFLASSSADNLILHQVGSGSLNGAIAGDVNSTRYAVVGAHLFSFASLSNVRDLGKIPCSPVSQILLWPSRAGVLCSGSSANATDVVFADLPHPGIAFHPRADPPPQYRLQLRPMQIPPAAPHAQWWIQDATTMPGDAIALALTGQTVGGGAVATVRGGNITLQAFPTPVPVPTTSAYAAELPTAARNYVRPVTPTRIVSDSGGTIWLNDSIQPVVYAMHGSVTSSRKLGDVKLRRGSNSVGLAFAGRLWYSSIEPAPRIASVDGTRSFDLPSQVGPIRMLRTGSDGQLWFANEKVYGRMSLDGKFSLWPFPAPQGWRTYPEPVFVAGLAHTMWLAAGASIWKITDGVIARQYHLPDRILGVRTLAQQCDGSLLVAPDDAQLLRIATSGAIEQYDIPYQQIDALLRGADCKMWFAAGTNSPQQFTGTLSLAPR